MRRKNTAEAFEILLEIAEEGKKKRLLARDDGPAEGQPAAPAADSPPGTRIHIVERAGAPPSPVAAPPSAAIPTYQHAPGRLRRDPLLRAPPASRTVSRRPPFPGRPAAPFMQAPPPASPVEMSAAPPAGQPFAARDAGPAPATSPPQASAPRESPAAAPPRPAKKGLGRFLSQRIPAGEPVEEPREAAGAAASASPPVTSEEFLSHEERDALAGNWGIMRRPSIDPEVLRSLGDTQRFQEPGNAATRAPLPNEIRLLEPREPPSRFGPGRWDEAPARAGSSTVKPAAGGSATGGPSKGASGPAKRSRSRKGGGADRSRGTTAPSRPAPDPDTRVLPDPAPPAPLDSVPEEAAGEMTASQDASIDLAEAPLPVVDTPPVAPRAPISPAPIFQAAPATRAAAPPEAPAASPRGVVAAAMSWMSGLRAVTVLERRIELKISTITAIALSGAIILVLVLTWLRLPPKEDAMLASFLPAEGGNAIGGGGEEGKARTDLLRPLPLWSPSSAPPGEPVVPAPPTARPDIRNVETLPPADAGTEPADAALAGAGEGGGEPVAPRFVYMIQVRGKESMEGARKILDYLGVFGFDQHRTEPDPRGAKNSDGKPYYTVFVGAYGDRAEADRECSRLKRATRDRPFRGRPDFADFFDDAFVITRSATNDKAPGPTPP